MAKTDELYSQLDEREDEEIKTSVADVSPDIEKDKKLSGDDARALILSEKKKKKKTTTALNWGDLEFNVDLENLPSKIIGMSTNLYSPSMVAQGLTGSYKFDETLNKSITSRMSEAEYVERYGKRPGEVSKYDDINFKFHDKINARDEVFDYLAEDFNFVSVNGFDPNTDYSKNFHTINVEDEFGNPRTIQYVLAPKGFAYGLSGGGQPTMIRENSRFIPMVDDGGEYIHFNPDGSEIKKVKKGINRIPGWDNMTVQMQETLRAEWDEAIWNLNNLIDEYNNAEDEDIKLAIAKELNKYQYINNMDDKGGDGLWVPIPESENKGFQIGGGHTMQLFIDGKPYPDPYKIDEEWGGLDYGIYVSSVSSDGQEVTFSNYTAEEGNKGITKKVNIQEILSSSSVFGAGGTELDLKNYYEAGKVKLGNTFIYSEPVSITPSEIRKDPVLMQSIQKGDVSMAEILSGRGTSIQKGVLNWINPEDGLPISEIFSEDVFEFTRTIDDLGRTVLSVTRTHSVPDKIIAQYTDGTSMEVGTEKYLAWEKIMQQVQWLQGVERGADLDSPNWVSPYSIEQEMQKVKAQIVSFNTLYGDENKREVVNLMKALVDTYFDKTGDYVVPSRADAYDMYLQFTEGNPNWEPLSKQEFYYYNGWDDGSEYSKADLEAADVLTKSDVRTQARYLRNLKFFLANTAFSEQGGINRLKEIEEAYSGQNNIPSIMNEFRSFEKAWTREYGERTVAGSKKQKEEIEAGGIIGMREFFKLQTMTDSWDYGILESIVSAFYSPTIWKDALGGEVWSHRSIFEDWFYQNILYSDDKIIQFVKDMDDQGLLPMDAMSMDVGAWTNFMKGFTTVGQKGGELVTPMNIALTVSGAKGLQWMKTASPKAYEYAVKTFGTAIFGSLLYTSGNKIGDIVTYSNLPESEQNSQEISRLIGELTFDGLMISPFMAYGGVKGYQWGKKKLSDANTSYNNFLNTFGSTGSLAVPYESREVAILGGNVKEYLTALLAQPEGRKFMNNFLKKGKVDNKNKKALDEKLKKEGITPENIDLVSKELDEVVGTLLQKFIADPDYMNKDLYAWQKYLDNNWNSLTKTFFGKNKLNKDDNEILRRFIGDSYNSKFKVIQDNIRKANQTATNKPTGKGGEPTPPSGKMDEAYNYTGNINLDKYPEDLRNFIGNLGRFLGKEINKEIRALGKKNWKDIDDESIQKETIESVLRKVLNVTDDELAAGNFEFTAAEYLSAERIMTAIGRNLINNQHTMRMSEYEAAMSQFTKFFKSLTAHSATTGRKLNIHKHPVSDELAMIFSEGELITAQGNFILDDVNKMLQSKDKSPTKINNLINSLVEVSRNAKLFSIGAVVRSTIGNSSNQALLYTDKPISAFYDAVLTNLDRYALTPAIRRPSGYIYSKLTGKEWESLPAWMQVTPERSRFFGETLAYTKQAFSSYFGGKYRGEHGTVYKNIKAMLYEDKNYLKTDAFYTKERFSVDGYIGGAWGKLIRTPQRSQAAIDIFFRQPAEEAFVAQYIFRHLKKNGYRPGTKEWKREFDSLIKDPPKKIVDEAIASAEYSTFQAKLGALGDWASRQRSGNVGTFFQFWIPFFNTPVNIGKTIYHRTPGIGFLSKDGFKGMGKGLAYGDWGIFADVASKQTTASGFAYTMYSLANNMYGGYREDGTPAPLDEANEQGYRGYFKAKPYEMLSDYEKMIYEIKRINPGDVCAYTLDGTTECWSPRGFSPGNEIMSILGSILDGQGDPSDWERFENGMISLAYTYLENPFVGGIDMASDLIHGNTSMWDFWLETFRSSLMPNMMLSYGSIIDPYYYESQDYNNKTQGYRDVSLVNPSRYSFTKDPNILWRRFEKTFFGGYAEVFGGDTASSVLEGLKNYANEEREKKLPSFMEDNGYTEKEAREKLNNISDLIMGKDYFNDYTINLPRLDLFGEPVLKKQGVGSLFGLNTMNSAEIGAFWGNVPEKYSQIMEDPAFWQQARNLIVDELVRLNLFDKFEENRNTVMGAPLSRIDKWLVNAANGQNNFIWLMNNMIFDIARDDQGRVIRENGRERLELNLDENGNLKLSKRWAKSDSDEDVRMMVQNMMLENVQLITEGLAETSAHKFIKTYNLETDWLFNPKRDYSFLFKAEDLDNKDFVQYLKETQGKVTTQISNAEEAEAFLHYQAFQRLKELEPELYEGKLFDAKQNYEMLLREAEEELE